MKETRKINDREVTGHAYWHCPRNGDGKESKFPASNATTCEVVLALVYAIETLGVLGLCLGGPK